MYHSKKFIQVDRRPSCDWFGVYLHSLTGLFSLFDGLAFQSSLHVPGLVGVVLFYLLILAVGILAAWKTKTLTSNNRDDYMVAGRNMGLGLGTVTLTGLWLAYMYILYIKQQTITYVRNISVVTSNLTALNPSIWYEYKCPLVENDIRIQRDIQSHPSKMAKLVIHS